MSLHDNAVWIQDRLLCHNIGLIILHFAECIVWIALLCRVWSWWDKTTPGWFYHPKGGSFNRGFIPPPKGWFYHLKGGGFNRGIIPPKGWLFPPKVLSPVKA